MRKYFLFVLLVSLILPLQSINGQTQVVQNLETSELGIGVYPDVVFLGSQIWVVGQQGSAINVFRGTSASNLSLFTSFPLTSGALAFSRIGVFNNAVWIAYRGGEPSYNAVLWRSDTGASEILGPAYGNNPVAIGAGYVAWQSAPDFSISLRSLTGGSSTIVRSGAPTGISRVINSSTVVLIDEDRGLVDWGLNPTVTWPLIVTEGPDSGTNLRINNDPNASYTLWSGLETFVPRSAVGPNGSYAVVTRSPNTIRVASFTSSIQALAPPAELTGGLNAQVNFSGISSLFPPIPVTSMTLGQLIQFIFIYSLYILGVVVFIMVLYAGFLWLTAAGNGGKISQAKSKIYNAIIGSILLVSAYLILNTINPDLVGGAFNLPGIQSIGRGPGITNNGTSNAACGQYLTSSGADFRNDVSSAISRAIASNPGLADQPANTNNVGTFRDLVMSELESIGLEATPAYNGNCNRAANRVGVRSPGNSMGELYDVVREDEASTIEEASTGFARPIYDGDATWQFLDTGRP